VQENGHITQLTDIFRFFYKNGSL